MKIRFETEQWGIITVTEVDGLDEGTRWPDLLGPFAAHLRSVGYRFDDEDVEEEFSEEIEEDSLQGF